MRKVALVLALLAACSPDSPSPSSKPGPATSPPAASGSNVIAFEAPSAWIKEEPANNLRKAQYRVPEKLKQAQDAVMFVTTSRISVSLEDNLRMWKDQMGGADAKTESFEGKHAVTIVDLSGTYSGPSGEEPIPNARMLVATVETDSGPWYFKLVGPIETVSGWHDEFVALLKGAKK